MPISGLMPLTPRSWRSASAMASIRLSR
jgi:hypothetical protein